MLYIIAGEDIATSRNKLNELISDVSDIVRIDGKKQSLGDIESQLSSDSLFAAKQTIIIEFFLKTKPQKEFFEILLKFESDKNTDIFLWDNANLTPTIKAKFKKAKILEFTFPKAYYEFLDGFTPDSKKSAELLVQVLKTFEAQQVLYGLIRRVRQLLILKTGKSPDFAEFKSMQDWQLGKLQKQAQGWREDQLEDVFIKLTKLDEEIKTSGLTMNLSNHLDIILISDLN